jgi:protein-tyrosine phosphatase
MSDTARPVAFEACFNFRDLGGYETADGHQVRWNMLYRSDTLHRLTTTDAETFAALGLKTVVDLRSGRELEDFGHLAVARDTLLWHHVPMLDDVRLAPRDPAEDPQSAAAMPVPPSTEPGAGYVAIVERYRESVAKVFELLCSPDAFPAVFHCTSGKDRTGVVAAMVLDLLGVPDEVIAHDYVATERTRARSTAWITVHEPDFAAYLDQVPPERRAMSADTILGFLAGIRSQHGTVRAFLTGLGVDGGQLDTLRERLLTD